MNECGILVYVKDGVVSKLEGDRDDPVTKGIMCAKGLASTQYVYHPDRVLYPLRRTGKRGSGKWERIGWDEALDTVSQRLTETRDKYGPEGVAFATGTYRGWFQIFMRLVYAFGSPNWGEPGMAQCMWPRCNGGALTFGSVGTFVLKSPDYDRANCAIVWGENPCATFPLRGSQIIDLKARGGKLIVVDPRFSATASKADLWLQVRPGTDIALALGMIHVIIEEGLYDKDFVKKWCGGFEELRQRAKPYTPAKTAEITWIPKEDIVAAARLYAGNGPSGIAAGVTIDQTIESLQFARVLCLLIAVTGNVDVPGGNYLRPSFNIVEERELALVDQFPEELTKKRLGFKRYPFLCAPISKRTPGAHMPSVWKAMLSGKPYPIRSMFIAGSNAVVSHANSNELKKAFMSLDFIAVVDQFMNETTQLADVFLPAATWLERSELVPTIHATYDRLMFRQKVIEPLGESLSDVNIYGKLARRMGFGQYFWKDEDQYLDYLLSPRGITFEDLKKMGSIEIPMRYRKYETEGFNSPSGKVELVSSTLEGAGFDPLPDHREPPESPISSPEKAREYPLILTSGNRTPLYFHTEYRNLPWLRAIIPDPTVDIHPQTARDLGIKQGDWVRLETPRGSASMRANLTQGVHPKVIATVHGWTGSGNDNALTDNEFGATAIGSCPYRGLLARVSKESCLKRIE